MRNRWTLAWRKNTRKKNCSPQIVPPDDASRLRFFLFLFYFIPLFHSFFHNSLRPIDFFFILSRIYSSQFIFSFELFSPFPQRHFEINYAIRRIFREPWFFRYLFIYLFIYEFQSQTDCARAKTDYLSRIFFYTELGIYN